MDVKYSQYDLINRNLLQLEEKGWLNRLIDSFMADKRLTFKILVPNEFFLRAEVLCDDILQLRSSNQLYTQGELAEHVFLDFLDEVRQHDGNVGAIYTRLDVRVQDLPLVNDQPLFPARSLTGVTVKLHRDDVLRAEVLLQDLSYFKPDHGIDVENLIEIVYLDFLLEYTKGRRKNVIKEIIEFLE